MNKYIDAEHLRKEVKRLEKAAHKSALGCADSEKRKFHEGKDFAYQHVGILIDSLQQEQPIQVSTLTWKDINDLEQIINNVHYEFRNGIGEKSFGEEVLERFREERDEQDQPEVDLEKIIGQTYHDGSVADTSDMNHVDYENIARHFYELGKLNAKKEESK